MKKLPLLLGTLGGALGGYLLSNKKLREELANANDAEEAARLLGHHLQQDGKKLATQVKHFVESDEVQANLKKAKNFAQKKVDEATGEFKAAFGAEKRKVGRVAKSLAKKGKAGAVKAARRMRTKVRKISS